MIICEKKTKLLIYCRSFLVQIGINAQTRKKFLDIKPGQEWNSHAIELFPHVPVRLEQSNCDKGLGACTVSLAMVIFKSAHAPGLKLGCDPGQWLSLPTRSFLQQLS